MDTLLPDDSLWYIISLTTPLGLPILWLIGSVCRAPNRQVIIYEEEEDEHRASQAIADKFLMIARRVHLDDEINSLDTDVVKQSLRQEIPAKLGVHQQGASPPDVRLPAGLPRSVVNFFHEWGDLDFIETFKFRLGADHVVDYGSGVFEIGSSETSVYLVVMTSNIVFERDLDADDEWWEVTPIAKSIHHLALKLCRQDPAECHDEADLSVMN